MDTETTMLSKTNLRFFNRVIEKLITNGWPLRYIFRLCASLNFAPTATVRGIKIRCLIPIAEVGVFDMFRQWEAREPETLDWIDTMTPPDVFLDIGAGFGTESLYAARKPNGPGRIICIDGDLITSFIHANNIKINHVSQVELYLLAFSDLTGIINFTAPSNIIDLPGMTRRYPISYHMPTLSVDTLCQERTIAPTHIKIDVDGAEQRILNGMPHTLANPRTKSLLIEVSQETRGSVVQHLDAEGFTLRKEVRQGPTSNYIFARGASFTGAH